MLSTLLEMSLAGACLIIVVIVLRALLLHRLPKALFFWLWMLALLRLLLPVFPASPLSVFARWEQPAAQWSASVVVQQAPQGEAMLAPVAPQAPPVAVAPQAPAAPQASSAAAPEAALMPALTCVWLAVSLLLALLLGLVYARGLRRFQSATPLHSPFLRAWLKRRALRRAVDVRLCPRIDSPMTYGLLRPVILLPESVGKADTQTLLCALEHELSHIRHFDAVWKLLIAVAVCLHWFNPLVWAMAILANRDIELCCDARVLRRGGKEERRAYASALLRMEEARARILPLTNAFSRNALEERIGAIMNAKKISITALLLTLLIVAVALTAFAAAPKSGTATPPIPTATRRMSSWPRCVPPRMRAWSITSTPAASPWPSIWKRAASFPTALTRKDAAFPPIPTRTYRCAVFNCPTGPKRCPSSAAPRAKCTIFPAAASLAGTSPFSGTAKSPSSNATGSRACRRRPRTIAASASR